MKLTKLFIFCFLSILFSVYGQAQDLTVKGKVIDEKGVPISGATIILKGTSLSGATDFDGRFQINAPKNGVLSISFIGYKTVDLAVNGQTSVEVKMYPASQDLNEVIVVGYGTQKKSVTTGAISSVRARDLEKVPNGRVEQALQGRVSGVTIAASSGQPGSNSTVRVRGVTTFAGNDPLWVVDGVVVDAGGIGFLNQSDIESIEVLKDAASAAIYGTRAASGVILVTTKKGKSGKMTVNYNGFAGISSPEKTLNLLNATQYGALMNEKSIATGGPVLFSDLSALGTGTDWQKAIFNTNAMRYSHELSISGGNDVSTFYASFGIQDQEGIVTTENSKYNKKSFRLNSTHKLSKFFTFGQTLAFTHVKSSGIDANNESNGPLISAINLDPITPLVETDPIKANSAPYSGNAVIRDANGNPYGISSLVGQGMVNPLAYTKIRLGAYGASDDLVGNTYLEAAINKHIKVRSTLGGKLSYWDSQIFTPVYYLGATYSVSKNSFSKSQNKSFAWNIENIVTYTNKFGNHNLTVLLGQGSYVDNIGGGSTSKMYGLPITNYRDASFNFDIPQSNRESSTYDLTEHKLTSLFSRINYDYKEKYLFTGIVRRDGSSRFGINHKFGVFPSFNLGWVVTKEDFWKENDVLNTLKIRGGYGIVGNDNIGEFRYLSLVNGGYNYSFGNTGAIASGYANLTLDNPDLKWEETSQANIGFESTFFNALNLTVDLYKKKTAGILRPINIPGYVGVATNPAGNVADMENKGIEVELGYKKKLGEVNFSVNGSVAYLKNEVTYIAADSDYITGDAGFPTIGQVTRTQVGQSYNSFYGFKTAGIFQNQAEINTYTNTSGGLIQPNAHPGDFRWVDTDGSGSIDDKDKQFLGSNIPKYTFGLTLNLDYKNFDFMVFTQGVAGNKIFQGLRRLDVGDANYQTIALSRWTGEGTSNDYPRLTNNDTNGNFGKMSDFYLEKGDYLRLKLVQLGYSLPSDVISKIGANKVRMYLTAENLFTLTKYTGYDPEIGGGVFGIDRGIYPQARTFMLGVNLQF
ncbi:TonB-linked SusC/RagA family outer membrane protein [Flavobacterium sp. 1]|uniref:SusC/RagA family TonB-linked outer membrane protein n=1 Tax=Flavobacterium sp. 1 TaxID=2035200 RepID=UPI000C23337A|nr:TonB-dependent receptor [Flavobacterium sp. 1]PJJ08336.1 TonB-linked SusC/RagA family outer membrane protein [Flavobacterium sp. 1]